MTWNRGDLSLGSFDRDEHVGQIKYKVLPVLFLILQVLHPSLVIFCSIEMQSPYISPLYASLPLFRSFTVTSAELDSNNIKEHKNISYNIKTDTIRKFCKVGNLQFI